MHNPTYQFQITNDCRVSRVHNWVGKFGVDTNISQISSQKAIALQLCTLSCSCFMTIIKKNVSSSLENWFKIISTKTTEY